MGRFGPVSTERFRTWRIDAKKVGSHTHCRPRTRCFPQSLADWQGSIGTARLIHEAQKEQGLHWLENSARSNSEQYPANAAPDAVIVSRDPLSSDFVDTSLDT